MPAHTTDWQQANPEEWNNLAWELRGTRQVDSDTKRRAVDALHTAYRETIALREASVCALATQLASGGMDFLSAKAKARELIQQELSRVPRVG